MNLHLARQLLRKAAWAPLAVLIFHSTAAAIYSHEPYVDPIAHFLGGLAIAYFIRHSAIVFLPGVKDTSPLALDLLAFGLANTIAVLWELGELGSDLFLGSNIQNSARNVLRDLSLGGTGALLHFIFCRFSQSKRSA